MDNTDSLSNDLSFVILGSDSSSTEFNGDRCPPSFAPSQHQSFDFHSALDVQEKLDLLLKENTDLKNALNQNNLAMKTQFETLAEWQKEVLLTHQTHKQKFTETRELVLKLKNENLLLKNNIDEKHKVLPNSSFQREVNKSHEASRDFEKLKAENLILVKERDAFREECTRLTVKISDLESIIRNKSEEMSNMKSNYDSLTSMCQKRPHSMAKSEIYSTSVQPTDTALFHPNDYCSLQSWACVQEMPGKETALKEENDALKRLLHEEMSKGYAVADMVKREENLKKEIDLMKNKEEAMDLKFEEMQKSNNELLKKEKFLTSELEKAKLKNNELLLEADKLFLLQTQMKEYEDDFHEERAAREKLAGEKESLCKEIRDLKRMLDTPAEEPKPETSVSSKKFECPICKMRFFMLSDCETHVDSCLTNPTHAL